MEIYRRSFFGLAAAVAAPAVIRTSGLLMPVKLPLFMSMGVTPPGMVRYELQIELDSETGLWKPVGFRRLGLLAEDGKVREWAPSSSGALYVSA